MFAILILFAVLQSSTAAIQKLNDTEYARMPPVFYMDQYEECFDEPEAIYCSAEFLLVSDQPSELLTMIQEYSAFPTHYNRTLLRHGYCMKKTCKKFYSDSGVDLKLSLEACVNETLFQKYKLKAIVVDNLDCSKRFRDQSIDYLDIFVALICIAILMANLIGSLCDIYLEKGMDRGVLRYLYCFSLIRNWKKFIAPPNEDDASMTALKGIHGIRAITAVFVITGHSSLFALVFNVNPEDAEYIFEVPWHHIFINGTLIMQTFLVISSFLLVYNWLTDSEKHEISWNMLPQKVIMRWFRLTLTYALVLGLTITWFGKYASGPFFKMAIGNEISDCRRDWWKHLLYINNYFDNSTCMPHTWYLAADTQLYFMGIFIFLMCRTNITRKVMLSLIFGVGVIVPALHIYFQNLDGTLMQNPEEAMNFFANDPTFHHVYKRGHTNLTGYAVGMAVGYMIYYWMKSGGDPKKFLKYRYFYWSLVFWGCLCTFSSVIFYQGDEQPIYIHVLFGALLKPVFGIIMALIMTGVIIQFEGLYRTILEWQPFMYVARLSFCAYLVHVAIIKTEVVTITALQRPTVQTVGLKIGTMVISTFIAAFFVMMLVESPSENLNREFFRKRNTESKGDIKETVIL